MVAGRTTEARAVTGVGTTSGAKGLTAPANSFNEEDAGAVITGSGIGAGNTIASVASGTSAQLTNNASATATVTVTIGGRTSEQLYGFYGWSPETDAESESYTNAAAGGGATGPDRIVNTFTAVSSNQRARG